MSDELPEFGDYVWIEQKRYGAENEDFQYKVINTMVSNAWRHAPADGRDQETHIHDHSEPVVSVILAGVNEERVERFRVADIKRVERPRRDWTAQ